MERTRHVNVKTDRRADRNLKGHNSVKNEGGVTVLVLCTRLMVVYISTKFHENILGVHIERTRLLSEKIQRAIIP